MSGIVRHNYPAFTAACILLRNLEWDILSPHEEHPFMENRDATPKEWQTLLREDIGLLLGCVQVSYSYQVGLSLKALSLKAVRL